MGTARDLCFFDQMVVSNVTEDVLALESGFWKEKHSQARTRRSFTAGYRPWFERGGQARGV